MPRDTPADASTDDRRLSRRRLLGGAATVGAAGVAGCTGTFVHVDTAETTLEREFGDADVARLRVEEATDDVHVERFDGDAVRVRTHKRASGGTAVSDLELRSTVDGDTLRLTTHTPNVVGFGGGSVDLEIAVPEGTTVERVETTDGDVALREIAGDTAIRSGDGDVSAVDVDGGLDARTSDGSVVVDGASGPVTARAADGDVTVRNPGSVVDVRTADGDVFAAVPAVDGSATVETGDGDVTVELGEALDASVDVQTGDGRATVANALDAVTTTDDRRVAGRVGDGTNELSVQTGDGDVTLTSR